MAAAAAIAFLSYWLVLRWARSAEFTNLDALALAGGALVGHTLIGVINAHAPFDRGGLLFIAALTVALLLLLARSVQARSATIALDDASKPAGS